METQMHSHGLRCFSMESAVKYASQPSKHFLRTLATRKQLAGAQIRLSNGKRVNALVSFDLVVVKGKERCPVKQFSLEMMAIGE